ncbi:MAG: single-stranded-DNA-specific exonuclease RecJ [Candidatus Omnitrophica bacterium]|nr:single-stranded-DNA-specific exonuclease RecJ [Candidatus Omnitrophota bacterium]MBU1808547.1 single-stranded-DNA-specific exonuclease RecJ [Candidatus Omnitrophota bacterium]
MRKIWRIKDPDPLVQGNLAESLKISRITAQLLMNRGMSTTESATEFMNSSLASCHDPFLFKDMDKAIQRIKRAILKKEKILVYGDYDVDGMTSVTIVYSALKHLGASVDTYIPNRIEEGYGLNNGAIKKAHAGGISLIITVDCGITSFKEVDHAAMLDIDVIITDHHEVMEGRVPRALAVINALQGDCAYPFKHLAGVGIAYKLVKALYEGTPHFAEDFLDLVALGTVADIAPLLGENRTLTKHGLAELTTRNRVGLKALMDVAGLGKKDISSGHIGFALGPRINAMGRVGSPQKALDLLLGSNEEEAINLAKVLDSENKSRQKIEKRILDEALAKVEREVNFKDHRIIVLASENWHPGVIGIVASRLADRFYRPAIMISLDGKMGKGSGRSIEHFHLFEYLLRCKEHLAGFGGHEGACGITIDKDSIADFREKINAEAAKDADEAIFSEKLDIDIELPLCSLNEDVIKEMESLSPFGSENPRPVLASRNLTVKDGPRPIGKNGFKIWVTDGQVTCEAITFNKDKFEYPETGRGADIAYMPSVNDWQGVRSIQLELLDIK